ncbi:MAG TPA: hypothetical protein VK770_16420 [Candidatus Acidoferrum sp.]|jgi:hypothetical protein|nr:hypothetical protein [Candidatus Acidoferrum sp.]
MHGHLQRRISSPGRLAKSALPDLAMHILTATLFACVVQFNAHAQSQTELSSPPQQRSAAQEYPAKPAATASTPASNRLGDSYLMLVNSANADQMDASKVTQFDRSPYDGLAISFANAYDTSPVPTLAQMEAQTARWKKSTDKEIWPWVYLNRMVGANDAEGNPYTKAPYFQMFQGLDLDGKAGAQNDFLQNWRNALRLARETRAPGIVFDPEFYNNYKAYDVAELARMTSKPQPEVLNLLRQLGARMADISSAEYPGASIWFLFTGFTRSEHTMRPAGLYDLAATYIVEGLLDQIQLHRLPIRVLSGGEVGLGYCHASVDDLRRAIEKRAADFSPFLHKYNGILELAGTMTLWSDRSAKKGWVANGACGSSSAASVEDLIPYMELLFRTYRYSWLYGSPNGGYFAFQSTSAARFDSAINEAKERAFKATGARPGI